MQTAAAEPALAAGPLDEQLTARLLQQRIIVLGSEVEDRIANRLCAQLLLLSDGGGDGERSELRQVACCLSRVKSWQSLSQRGG